MNDFTFWKEIKTSCCYQKDFETVYSEVISYLCSNCGKFSPGHKRYPFCPYCGKEMKREEQVEFNGIN